MRRFQQVDVFTESPLQGNPVAVVLDGTGLADEEMAAVARWTNLSETTFVSPPTHPDADYSIRILTPGGELDFAGHPTLGTAHAWLGSGGTPKRPGEVVQEGNVGLVRIRTGDPEPLAFAAPPTSRRDPTPAELVQVVSALGVEPAGVDAAQVLDNGTEWFALRLRDAAMVLSLEPDHQALRSCPKVGVIGPHAPGAPCAIEVRAFAASIGITEDPVTGSLQASAAHWLIDEGVLPSSYVAAQGTCVQRTGRVRLEQAGDDLWVGGGTHTIIEGSIAL